MDAVKFEFILRQHPEFFRKINSNDQKLQPVKNILPQKDVDTDAFGCKEKHFSCNLEALYDNLLLFSE